MDNDKIQIRLEFTPNPTTLKFVVNRSLLEKGSANFTSREKAAKAPLAATLLGIPGLSAVLVGTNFVTVTKSATGDWDVIAEQVPEQLEAFLKSGRPTFDPDWASELTKSSGGNSAIEKKIREILDSEIRPAVAMDGGDIIFDRFDDGVVYLHLQGACSSCPSSTATLRMGVEVRLKELIPEIREVVQA